MKATPTGAPPSAAPIPRTPSPENLDPRQIGAQVFRRASSLYLSSPFFRAAPGRLKEAS